MKTYLIYPANSELKNGFFHISDDNYKNVYEYNELNEFESLTQQDRLIYLLPSSLVNSISFIENNKLSAENNIANFISEIDTKLINQVSDNKFFLNKDVGYVLNKSIYQKINSQLSTLKCRIIMCPDYFLNKRNKEDTITEFNNKYLFAFGDGTGTLIDFKSLQQYLYLVQQSFPNFDPYISIQNKDAQKLLKDFKNKSTFSISQLIEKDLNVLPNLYKFDISFKNIMKRLNFRRSEIYLSIALMLSMISIPYILIAQNNKYTNIYQEETFNIFKKVDKNTKRVVTPKIQIDQLINQIPISYRQTNNNVNDLKDLEFLLSLGDKFINTGEIDFTNKTAILLIKDMPEIQYKLISGISNKFGVLVLEDDISVSNSLASGLIKIKFK
tara:strand:- start:3408 stop:4562 length:1155 start_codon:yes stop_codon:yes gene_type:complete